MSDTSTVSALARNYGAQFAAGFLTTAITVGAIYTAHEQLAFARPVSGLLPPSVNTTVLVRSDRAVEAAFHQLPMRQDPSPLRREAAYEIASRFADLSPVVSSQERPLILVRAEPDPSLLEPEATGPIPTASEPPLQQSTLPLEQKTLPPPAVAKQKLHIARVASATASVAFPLDLNPSWGDMPRAGLLVGGLPLGATLSAGRPAALGLWKLPCTDAKSARIIVTPTAPSQFELTVFLVDPEGLVVNGIDVVVTISNIEADPVTRKAGISTAASNARFAQRRAAKLAKSYRHKPIEIRQFVHKARNSQPRQAAMALKSDAKTGSWHIAKSKTTAHN